MELWQLWLLFTLPKLASFFQFIGLIVFLCGSAGLIITTISIKLSGDSDAKNVRSVILPIYIVFSIIGFFSMLVPSKNEAMTIVGGYYVLNIEKIETLPPNIAKAANKFLEDYLDSE